MINWIVGIVALVVVLFLAKKGCRPAVWLFVGASAGLYIFLIDKLATMEVPWKIGAAILWFVIFLLATFVKKNHNKAVVSFLLIAVIAIGCMAFFAPKANAEATQEDTEPVYTQTGQQTWKMQAGDYTNNRWFADGVSEIQNATTQQDAVKAATIWLDKVKTDPTLLVGAAKFFLKEDVDKATLVDENGYATDKAIQLTERIALTLATSNIKVADAPSTGLNSGVENDTVVQASDGGIAGNTKSIQITDAAGQAIWIMARCGNPVTSGRVGVPTGTTDNPTTPMPPNPPVPDNPLTPKNPADDVTPPQGVVQLPAGELTNGQQSAEQKAAGQTSGNVTDNAVSGDTTSGSTTTDIGSGNGVSVGESDGTDGGGKTTTPDDIKDDVKDDSSATYDDGGTTGGTKITDPDQQ